MLTYSPKFFLHFFSPLQNLLFFCVLWSTFFSCASDQPSHITKNFPLERFYKTNELLSTQETQALEVKGLVHFWISSFLIVVREKLSRFFCDHFIIFTDTPPYSVIVCLHFLACLFILLLLILPFFCSRQGYFYTSRLSTIESGRSGEKASYRAGKHIQRLTCWSICTHTHTINKIRANEENGNCANITLIGSALRGTTPIGRYPMNVCPPSCAKFI